MKSCYKEQAIQCVQGYVLQNQKERFAAAHYDLDEFYSTLDDEAYFGKVITPGKEYELGYYKCTCAKVLSGEVTDAKQCECSRQSIIYILKQLLPDKKVNVRILETVLQGGSCCRFRITIE